MRCVKLFAVLIIVFLFILESIGTSELILIGIIALIFLGPRKLPQIAKTIGKTMADFRNTTNEFKETWQREVDFEEEARALRTGILDEPATVAREIQPVAEANTIAPPEIKPAQADLFSDVSADAHLTQSETVTESRPGVNDAANDDTSDEDVLSNKQSWL